MKLKKTVEKLEDVAENLRGLYTEKNGKFVLDIDGDDDVDALKRKNDELISEKRAAQKARDEATEQARIAAEEAARKSGNLAELEKSLTAKHTAELEKVRAEITKRDGLILGGRKDAILADLANNFISPNAAKLMMANLVDVGYGEDGQVGVTFKGIDGKPVTTDQKEFIKHLSANNDFKSLIKGSSANGGGAAPSGKPQTGKMLDRAEFDSMNPDSKMSFMREGGTVV